MAAQIHTLSIALDKEIGELSEKRVSLLSERGFQVIQKVDGQLVVVVSGDGSYQLHITPNNIICALKLELVESFFNEPDEYFGIFSEVIDTLMLNPEGIIGFQIEKSYDAPQDTLERAWTFLSDPEPLMFNGGAISVGYRIPLAYKDYSLRGEVKIEPFFADSSKYFISLVLQSEVSSSLDRALESLKIIISLFRSYEDRAAQMFS